MEPIKGTFTATLTGMTVMPKSEWYWRLGRRFAKWLVRVCGESRYVVDNRIPINYELSEDGKWIKVSLTGTSDETEMTLTGIPEQLQPK